MSWDYIAGFFDGEGSVCSHGKGFRITIPQTNEKVLKEILEFSGVGNILKESKRQAHWKDNWVYYVVKQKSVLSFLEKIEPFLIVKKALALEVLPELRYVIEQQNQRSLVREKRFQEALSLRSQGLSYHKIELKMKLDRGYIRRLILSKAD